MYSINIEVKNKSMKGDCINKVEKSWTVLSLM